jgi:O-antigen/teichoic acid export membrane protein
MKASGCVVEPDDRTVTATIHTIERNGSGPFRRMLSRFGQALSPDTGLHQSVLSLVDQGVSSATGFLTGVIIARACSKQELGLYMLGFSLVTLVTDLQTALITTPYMVYAPRLRGRAHASYTGSTLIHQLAFCMIAILGVACGAFAVSHGVGPLSLTPVLWALALVIALLMLRQHARRVSFARLKFKTALAFDTCIAVCQIGGLLILAHFHLLSASRAYWAMGCACGIAVFWWLWSDREFSTPRIRESVADLKKNWALGKWVFASGLVWTVAVNLYPWLLAAFHGVASTGIWAACLGVVSIGNPALLGIQNLVGPKISHVYAAKGPKALRRVVLKITAIIAVPVSLLSLVLCIWGGRLAGLLYGRQYTGNNLVVAILALNLLVGALAFSFSRGLFAVDRARVDFLINFAALFVMVTLGLWLVYAYGPLGAALGLLGATSASSAMRAILFLIQPCHISLEMERIGEI